MLKIEPIVIYWRVTDVKNSIFEKFMLTDTVINIIKYARKTSVIYHCLYFQNTHSYSSLCVEIACCDSQKSVFLLRPWSSYHYNFIVFYSTQIVRCCFTNKMKLPEGKRKQAFVWPLLSKLFFSKQSWKFWWRTKTRCIHSPSFKISKPFLVILGFRSCFAKRAKCFRFQRCLTGKKSNCNDWTFDFQFFSSKCVNLSCTSSGMLHDDFPGEWRHTAETYADGTRFDWSLSIKYVVKGKSY